jgi:glucose/arabinose dehydrogenase
MGLRRAAAAVLAATSIALIAACGGDDDDDSGSDAATTAAAETTKTEKPAGDPRLEKVGDFDQPVFVAQQPGSEDLLVVEQPGRIQRVARGGETSTALDISQKVTDGGEQGLLSVAFAPDFKSSRALFAYYTDADENQRVVRFTVAEDGTVDPASEREVLVMEDFASNHNGGLVLFGPDGMLYIGTGDGGIADDPERNGQNLDSLLGKILRIDPATTGNEKPYVTPPDNPFSGEQGARPEIYSYGLRNPWRFSFDRETDDLSIGDVGQNSLEEIDFVGAGEGAGANFGWSAFEGTERFNEDQEADGHVEPVLTYGRSDGCSVTGGYVVRDPALPALTGRYVYGDYCAGEVRSFRPEHGGGSFQAVGDRSEDLQVPGLSSFAEGSAGEIYATSHEGPVFRVVQ